MNTEIEQFTQGVFNMTSRRFGSFAEILVTKIYPSMKLSHSSSYDIYVEDKYFADGKARVECKFARAYELPNQKLKPENVYEQVMRSQTSNYERSIKCPSACVYEGLQIPSVENECKFDCIFEQVKPKDFDYLLFGIFFRDKLVIFLAKNSDIYSIPGYCNKQHKNSVDEGQFHITEKNFHKFWNEFMPQMYTYEQIIKKLQC